MTTKQKRFVDQFCTHFNGALAAREAGYSAATAKEEAYKLSKNEEVKLAIKQRLDSLAMSADEAIKRLSDWGRGSFSPFVTQSKEFGLEVDLSQPDALLNIHLLKKIKQTKKIFHNSLTDSTTTEYTTEIELHDAKDAVDKIAKIHALYIDRTELTGKDGKELFPVSGLTDEQLSAIASGK